MRILGIGTKTPRKLPTQTVTKMRYLLSQMQSQTEYKAGGVSILVSIENKGRLFMDSSLKPITLQPSVKSDMAGVKIDTLYLSIHTNNGEIVKSKKPLFWTWNKVYEETEKFIDYLKSNLNNSKSVQKNFLPLDGCLIKRIEQIHEAQIMAN